MFTGVRIGLGVGWAAIVAAELIGGSGTGLGYFIMRMSKTWAAECQRSFRALSSSGSSGFHPAKPSSSSSEGWCVGLDWWVFISIIGYKGIRGCNRGPADKFQCARRGVRLHSRTVGLRQNDAPSPYRRSRSADRRFDCRGRRTGRQS